MTHDVFVKQISVGPMGNYTYLLGDEKSQECVIIDPGWDPNAILKEAKTAGYKIVGIVLTHHHFDHSTATFDLLQKISVPVYIHKIDAPLLNDKINTLVLVEDQFRLKLGHLEGVFIHTPGHTAGGCCLLMEKTLFTGDTLFVAGCGRADLPDSNPKDLLKKVADRV